MESATLPGTLPETSEEIESEHEEISPYKVIFLDDPVTTMEFVIQVLMELFGKDLETAQRLMWEVHTQGAAQVAVLSKEQAELKQEQVHAAARARKFPFRCVIEPA
ncbi:MAG TPA: ATP-dependent Clp protease adaptor ClpS [Candidatus Manganitrophaceae bacterium]|nr:ATP-dependent Clp protease adaptor ClpS [Candidatus Manganitrophaceae bacterium]